MAAILLCVKKHVVLRPEYIFAPFFAAYDVLTNAHGPETVMYFVFVRPK